MTSVLTLIAESTETPAEQAPRPRHSCVGRIVALDEGVPRVDFPENPHGPIVARLALPAMDADLLAKQWQDSDVLIVFANGDLQQPIITGVVRHSLEDPLYHSAEWEGFRQLFLRAEDELVLQCGEARIVLRRDGTLTILGKEILSRAMTRHRIRGGTVDIN
jgi:Domain of unknown function (DUF6484)